MCWISISSFFTKELLLVKKMSIIDPLPAHAAAFLWQFWQFQSCGKPVQRPEAAMSCNNSTSHSSAEPAMVPMQRSGNVQQ
jgi:hypothetical protein